MTDEEKKAALEAKNKATAEAEAKAKEEAKARDDQTPEEKAEAEAKAKAEEESKQLEAQLQTEKEAGEAKDKIIADQAFKLRKKNRKDGEEDEDEDEDEDEEESEKGMTRAEVQAMMDSNNKTAQASEIKDIVSKMSDNDKVQELIILTHKNRTYPSNLSLKQQLEEAFLTANKGKILGENQELKRALTGNKNASTDGSQTHQDSPPGSKPKLSASTQAELTRLGYKWNGTSKRFEKKVKGGVRVRHEDGRVEVIKG